MGLAAGIKKRCGSHALSCPLHFLFGMSSIRPLLLHRALALMLVMVMRSVPLSFEKGLCYFFSHVTINDVDVSNDLSRRTSNVLVTIRLLIYS